MQIQDIEWHRSRYNSLYPAQLKPSNVLDIPSLGGINPAYWYPWPHFAPETHGNKEYWFSLVRMGDLSVLKDIRIRGALTGSRLTGENKNPIKDHRYDLSFEVLRCLATDKCPLTLRPFNWNLQYNRNYFNPGYAEYLGYVPEFKSFEQHMDGEGVFPAMLGASPALDRISLENYDASDTWFIDSDVNNDVKGTKKFTQDVVGQIHKCIMDMVVAGKDNDIPLPEDVRKEACAQIGYECD